MLNPRTQIQLMSERPDSTLQVVAAFYASVCRYIYIYVYTYIMRVYYIYPLTLGWRVGQFWEV